MNYYPSGLQFCNNVTDSDVQPQRYNGKELDKMHGLCTYDYGARQYNPVTARWDRMDPLCEKYYSASPYAYCGGDPVNKIDPDGRYVLMMFNKDLNELYVLDLDYYNNEKGLTFVDANNYKQGEYNQVLTIKNVFSGGELDENGDIIRDERKSEEREIENGYYDLLDNGADTEHSGWYRVDRIDNHRYNDKDDDNNRNGLRLHFGSLSHGCITISNRQEGFEETQNVLNTILDNTSIITVLDRSGWKRFYSNTQRTNYGTIIVTGNSKYKKREKK
jgi:RHS repeat-associated protein